MKTRGLVTPLMFFLVWAGAVVALPQPVLIIYPLECTGLDSQQSLKKWRYQDGGSDGAKRYSRPREGYGLPRLTGSSRISPRRGVIEVKEAAEGEKPWDGRFLS
jgi:hypothetical protein